MMRFTLKGSLSKARKDEDAIGKSEYIDMSSVDEEDRWAFRAVKPA